MSKGRTRFWRRISEDGGETFGPLEETTKQRIVGSWQNARSWVGSFAVNAATGDGYNYIRVVGGQAADDAWLVAGDDDARFRFEIVTSGVEALTLQANGGEGYVDLSWTQDDFELLAGYNLYRATSETGEYTRVNASIIPAATKQFRDVSVEPGRTYYYKFTVVQTDMAESQPSNIAQGTPLARWAEPEEIADAVLFLASNEARYVTGTVLRVDGGMRSK